MWEIGFPAVVACGIAGAVGANKGLRWSVFHIVATVVGLLIPVFGLLILAHVSGKVTEALKGAGYQVGLLGVKS